MLVGIITPALVVSGALGLTINETSLLVSMSLFSSGLATLIQVHGLGPFGTRLLSVQGTSFTFVPLAIAAGQVGGLSLILGMAVACAPVEIVLSRFLEPLRNWFPPVVTGTVVLLIGTTLIGVGMTDLAGGYGATDFGSPKNFAVGLGVLFAILLLGAWRNGKLASISIGLALLLGYLGSFGLGAIELEPIRKAAWFQTPSFLPYGLTFDPVFLLPWIVAYIVTALESVGDISATSKVSREPVEGPLFIQRLRGGVAADGLGSLLAGLLGSLPVTTFSQNNGVIALTGVAARRVGYGVGVFLVLMALVPKFGMLLSLIPKPVLGGATVLMFATVAIAGIGIISRDGWTPRKEKIVAVSLALGLGVTMVPESVKLLTETAHPLLRSFGVIAQSGMAIGALAALLLNKILPEDLAEDDSPERTT